MTYAILALIIIGIVGASAIVIGARNIDKRTSVPIVQDVVVSISEKSTAIAPVGHQHSITHYLYKFNRWLDAWWLEGIISVSFVYKINGNFKIIKVHQNKDKLEKLQQDIMSSPRLTDYWGTIASDYEVVEIEVRWAHKHTTLIDIFTLKQTAKPIKDLPAYPGTNMTAFIAAPVPRWDEGEGYSDKFSKLLRKIRNFKSSDVWRIEMSYYLIDKVLLWESYDDQTWGLTATEKRTIKDFCQTINRLFHYGDSVYKSPLFDLQSLKIYFHDNTVLSVNPETLEFYV